MGEVREILIEVEDLIVVVICRGEEIKIREEGEMGFWGYYL